MADETATETPETPAATNGEAPKAPSMQILGQFIRDLSFENMAAQKGTTSSGQPDIGVQVGLDARKRKTDGQYDITIKLKVEAKATGTEDIIFGLELDYAGIFAVTNVPDAQLHPYLLIECPRMLFPFLRRVVHDITRDGGFPPLNLEQIDFVQLYRSQIAQQAQKAQAEAAEATKS
jgi:preprotein translocase subunit SecB